MTQLGMDADPEFLGFDVVLAGRLFGLLRLEELFGLAEVALELGLCAADGVGGSVRSVAVGAEIGTAVTCRPAVSIASQAIPATEATAANQRVILAKIRVFRGAHLPRKTYLLVHPAYLRTIRISVRPLQTVASRSWRSS